MMEKLKLHHKLFLFCAALTLFRLCQTGQASFLFLFWNLFLAWLPYYFVIKLVKEAQEPYIKTPLIAASLAFLPNAPYIVTDLFHLKKQLVAPLWLDTILILSFAVLGLVFFIKAANRLIFHLYQLLPEKLHLYVKPLLFAATGYGIYVGRYLRYNSWDIIVHPYDLASGMFWSVFNPHRWADTIGATLTFTIFLYLVFEIYLSFRNKETRLSE
jgi:uncharacterized membrane protein